MHGMTIGALARTAGIHLETVRFYQRRGLLAVPPRPPGVGARRYGDEALARLRFIARAQGIGFSLAEVKQLLQPEPVPCQKASRLAREKLALVEQRIAELQRVRVALRALLVECGAGGATPCPLIGSLAQRSAPPALQQVAEVRSRRGIRAHKAL
jgi:MerR family transcriptional regulator, mercuric resistance operon regulatory protein